MYVRVTRRPSGGPDGELPGGATAIWDDCQSRVAADDREMRNGARKLGFQSTGSPVETDVSIPGTAHLHVACISSRIESNANAAIL